jgi:hypothetical protein
MSDHSKHDFRVMLFFVIAGTLSVVATAASAQVENGQRGPDVSISSEKLKETSAVYFSDCIKVWDRSTHMSKLEWNRTCRRVVDARVRFMLRYKGDENNSKK